MSVVSTTSAKALLLPPLETVVWDFDWSLINENSDTWIFEQLGQKQTKDIMADRSLQWTQRCDRAALSLQVRDAVSVREITAAFADIPCFPENIEVIRQLHLHGVAQYIVSDANVVFIHAFLDAHKDLAKCFAGVFSNKAWLQARGEAQRDAVKWFENFEQPQKKNHLSDSDSTAAMIMQAAGEAASGGAGNADDDDTATIPSSSGGGVLRIAAYHKQHSCDLCPVNMCKGSILRHDLFGVPHDAQTPTDAVAARGDSDSDSGKKPDGSAGNDDQSATCASGVGEEAGSVVNNPKTPESKSRSAVRFPTGSTIAYVGDGSGDLCAAKSLRSCDTLLVRRGFRLDSILQKQAQQTTKLLLRSSSCDKKEADSSKVVGTKEPIAHTQSQQQQQQQLRSKSEKTSQSSLKCRVLRWQDGADLKNQLLGLLEARKDSR